MATEKKVREEKRVEEFVDIRGKTRIRETWVWVEEDGTETVIGSVEYNKDFQDAEDGLLSDR